MPYPPLYSPYSTTVDMSHLSTGVRVRRRRGKRVGYVLYPGVAYTMVEWVATRGHPKEYRTMELSENLVVLKPRP